MENVINNIIKINKITTTSRKDNDNPSINLTAVENFCE